MTTESLQDSYAPNLRCFGCGPSNQQGLQIKSIPPAEEGGDVLCTWQPAAHHEAFPGMLNGGIIGTLLDCHCNWAAAWHLMNQRGSEHPPCTVTADYAISLKRPTPMLEPLLVRARIVESDNNRAVVEGEIEAGGKVTATCRGTFVAVREGHPAYHRW